MDKKYQVFVSSTYIDLLEERKEVIQALLELDCIPIGMELFPASDDDQWTFIKSVIDDCDYYVLVLAEGTGPVLSQGLDTLKWSIAMQLNQGSLSLHFCIKILDLFPLSLPNRILS